MANHLRGEYVSVYGLSNLIGHFFKIVSFYLIYKAIIETGLVKPYDLLFRDLKLREAELARGLGSSELIKYLEYRQVELASCWERMRPGGRRRRLRRLWGGMWTWCIQRRGGR